MSEWVSGGALGGGAMSDGLLAVRRFPQGLLGVKPGAAAAPGLPTDYNSHRLVAVRPAYGAGGLRRATGNVGTPFGAIAVAWAMSGGVGGAGGAGGGGVGGVGGVGLQLNLSVPVNARAAVWILAGSAADVSEGGGAASAAAGVAFVRQEGPDTVWSVGSGVYMFEVKAPAAVEVEVE